MSDDIRRLGEITEVEPGTREDALAEDPLAEDPLAEIEATIDLNWQGHPSVGGFGAESRYELLELLASGGTSSVYRAHDKLIRRHVAIKRLHPHFSEGKHRSFLREYQVTGQLDHPNVPPIHDTGVDEDGRPYLAMKLVRGKTLLQYLAGRTWLQLSAGERFHALQILLRVCEALAFAHEKGVIHCDLKPGNLMIGTFGQVYVMDWGIARVRSASDDAERIDLEDALESTEDQILGTLGYLSPEQAQGTRRDLGVATDIFSLGAILYRILFGRPPYQGDDAREVLRLASKGLYVPASQAGGDDPPPVTLARIADKAMEREPVNRYEDVAQLAKDLEGFMRGAEQFPTRTFLPGERIATEGEAANSAYVVLSGRAFIYKEIHGRRTPLGEVRAGEVFGEMSVLTEKPRTANVEAVERTTLAVVSSQDFLEGLSGHEWLASFFRTLAERFWEVDREATLLRERAWLEGALASIVCHVQGKDEVVAPWPVLQARLAERFGREPEEIARLVGEMPGITIEGQGTRLRIHAR